MIKKCFGYRKVKTRHVYLWRGLTRCFCFQKDFWNFNNQWSVIFSHWYSRLCRMLFNCNARVRPSIIGYRKGCCEAQETSRMTICTSVLDYYFTVYSVLRTSLYDCPVVCYWCCWTLMLYSDDVMYKQIYLFLCKDHLLSIIFYSAAMVRFCVVFLFSSSTCSSLTLMVRFFGRRKIGSRHFGTRA